nr:pentatricopeptide repeat-containing protein At4g30825, chloroplastic [Ipomoea batatas]
MASFKLSLSLDNSFESKKLNNFRVNSLQLTDRCCFPPFSGYINLTGAFVVNPICNLNPIRVCRTFTDVSDKSELVLEDNVIGSPSEDLGNEGSALERSNSKSDFRKGRFDIWKKRFKSAKKVSNDLNTRRSFRRKDCELGNELHVRIESPECEVNSENVIDFDVNVIRLDLSLEECNAELKLLEKCSDRKALKFFEWMKINGKLKQNITAYDLIFRVLGRREDWDGAEAVIKEMFSESGCEINYQVFNTLIYSCQKKGLVELGAKWFHMMLENGVRPNAATFGILMSLYQKRWNIEEAEFAFSKMRDLKITCQSAYSAMITIYTRSGLYSKAEDVIGFLREDEVALNQENWLVLLNTYSQQGKMHKAEQILALMFKAGFSPNIIAYNTLITGYGKASNMDTAQCLFEDLKRFGVDPDETTYRSMIEGWGRANNYKQAERYFAELKSIGYKPNSSNLYTMLNLQARHGGEEGAIRIIDEMVMIGCQKSSILGILLQIYEKVEHVDKVPLVLKGSLYDHVLKNQTSCSTLLMAYVKNGMITDALKILNEKLWDDSEFEDNLYHLLICLCKDFGHPENAVKIFTCMPKSDMPNLHIICTMIDIYSSKNLFTEAENLYLELNTSGIALDMIAFSVVVRMYVKSGALEKACAVLDIMDKQKNIVPDVYLLRYMLRIYQRCNLNDKLADLYYRILKSGVVWDQEMYNCVINCCARALPVDELSRLFFEMIHQGYSPNTVTFNVMLDVLGKSGLFGKARKVFNMAQKRGLVDAISYNTLIAAYGKGKDLDNMALTVRKMHFRGFTVTLEAYNCMLDAYGKEGQMEKFRDALQRMKESGCASDHYTYNIMINIYGTQGWIDEVSGVLMELKDSGFGPDLCSYNTLIKAYGIAGMVEDAVALIKEMRENGIEPDQITYTNLITALQRNDMFLEAVRWSLWMKQIGV